MRYLVNGDEADLPTNPPGVKITQTADRLLVTHAGKTRSALVARRGDTTYISFAGRVYEIQRATAARRPHHHADDDTNRAPMPGLIVEVTAAPGQKVSKGQKLMVLEAMKMQLPVNAHIDGTVKTVHVAPGDQVAEAQLLVEIDPGPAS